MPDIQELVTGLVVLATAAIMYFLVARRYNVYVHREVSSVRQVITGMGFLFTIAWLLFDFLFEWDFLKMTAAISILAIIGMADDIMDLSIGLRLFIQAIAAGLMIWTFPLLPPMLVFLLAMVWMNMFNFMDGINGMMGLYASVSIGFILYLTLLENPAYTQVTTLGILLMASFIIFSFGNIRKKAIWIAGDAGSVPLGLICLFVYIKALGLNSFPQESWLAVPVYFSVFLTDTGMTLWKRIVLRQNILQKHRQHIYQKLVYDKGHKSITVSILYAIIQLAIDFLYWKTGEPQLMALAIFITLIILWFILDKTSTNNSTVQLNE